MRPRLTLTWVWPLPAAHVPRLYFPLALISLKTQLTLLLIEQHCADRRQDLWQSYHHPEHGRPVWSQEHCQEDVFYSTAQKTNIRIYMSLVAI